MRDFRKLQLPQIKEVGWLLKPSLWNDHWESICGGGALLLAAVGLVGVTDAISQNSSDPSQINDTLHKKIASIIAQDGFTNRSIYPSTIRTVDFPEDLSASFRLRTARDICGITIVSHLNEGLAGDPGNQRYTITDAAFHGPQSPQTSESGIANELAEGQIIAPRSC